MLNKKFHFKKNKNNLLSFGFFGTFVTHSLKAEELLENMWYLLDVNYDDEKIQLSCNKVNRGPMAEQFAVEILKNCEEDAKCTNFNNNQYSFFLFLMFKMVEICFFFFINIFECVEKGLFNVLKIILDTSNYKH